MSTQTLKYGDPFWVVRGSIPEGIRSGVVLRPVDDGAGGDSDPTVLVLGWHGDEPEQTSSGSLLPVVVTQVRSSSNPDERQGELALDAPITLVTVMRVGPVPADELLEILSEATDHFLERFDAVEGVAFAKTADERWVVEVLRVASIDALRAIQGDPEMNAHIEHVGSSAASMEPHLHRVGETISMEPA